MSERPYRTIAILAAVSAVLWLMALLMRPREDRSGFTGPPRSDYTLENFTLDALDQDGAHTFTVSGPRLARRGDDGSIYVASPDYEIIDNGDRIWKGTSESAWVNKDGTVMRLEGKVVMHRLPKDKAPQIDVTTTDLTITTDPKPRDAQGHVLAGAPPRDKRMETAAFTTISDPNNFTRAVGMKADLDLKTVELLSDVHTISQPGKRNGTKKTSQTRKTSHAR